ncbi:RhuM family protein [Sphingobacterium olei]|uniref:RhuM family protein n=1 Tax=Sphingobacterium olei TaxID=2571155 RepID=UPI00138FF9F7|nr:RhuM family protein [Sphingobacterium olei]
MSSHQSTKFRQGATVRLREYIVKGFTMNDELLKQAGGDNYFDELLARIRTGRVHFTYQIASGLAEEN